MGLAEIIAGAVLLFLGVVVTRQEQAIGKLARIEERLQHVPTRIEVTKEIAETRGAIRHMLREFDTRIDSVERGMGRKSRTS